MRVLLSLLFGAMLAAADVDYVLVVETDGKRELRGDAARLTRRFTPCSTFKIPNTLIALDSGVAKDASFSIPYDPVRDPAENWWPKEWARDQDLRSALKYSALWFYKEIARRVGPERMKDYLTRFDYGNRDISGGIDRFWVSSSLRISAAEQIGFLRRFADNQLPVRPDAIAAAKEALILETGGDYVWRGKTGACGSTVTDPALVWHTGYVEKNGKSSVYALNISGPDTAPLQKRRLPLLRKLLSEMNLLPAEPPSSR